MSSDILPVLSNDAMETIQIDAGMTDEDFPIRPGSCPSSSSFQGISHSLLQAENQTFTRRIFSDLSSTYTEELDLLKAEEEETRRISNDQDDISKTTQEEEDEKLDPLFFYYSQYSKDQNPNVCSDEENEDDYLLIDDAFKEIKPIEMSIPEISCGIVPTLPPKPISPFGIVSFGSLKPLTGQLTHSCSVESATSMATASSSYSQESSSSRFRDYQAEQWHERFEELRQFVEKHGHCQISHKDPEHNALARWSKRQRYQFKLLRDGKPSTMTEERIVALNGLGFAWNSHEGNYQLMD